jgi:hypothetical protein
VNVIWEVDTNLQFFFLFMQFLKGDRTKISSTLRSFKNCKIWVYLNNISPFSTGLFICNILGSASCRIHLLARRSKGSLHSRLGEKLSSISILFKSLF